MEEIRCSFPIHRLAVNFLNSIIRLLTGKALDEYKFKAVYISAILSEASVSMSSFMIFLQTLLRCRYSDSKETGRSEGSVLGRDTEAI